MGRRSKGGKRSAFPEVPAGVPLSQWAAGKNGQLLATRGEVLNIITMLMKADRQRHSYYHRVKRWFRLQWHRWAFDFEELGLWAQFGTRKARSSSPVMPPPVDHSLDLLEPEPAPAPLPAAPVRKETLA